MSLSNYRDVSKSGADVHAGFQFEFNCGVCSRTWKSPFKPYRTGQLSGLIYKFAYFFGDRGSLSRTSNEIAGVGWDRARAGALNEAIELAEQRYTECPGCSKAACENCWNGQIQLCEECASRSVKSSNRSDGHSGGADAAGQNCSNCGSPMQGGRFCAECGFDVASSHKACPGCGVLCARAARFCPDCGHGF